MARSASLFIALSVLASCSFTTAGSFKECNSDSDCGSATACSKGYCLTLPEGCKREEAGGSIKAFEQADRIPIAAILPLTDMGSADDSETQGVNAMRLAVSEVNDRMGLRNRSFGLFVCNTNKTDEPTKTQIAWMVENLQVPAIIMSGSGQTTLGAKHPVRIDAGTMVISATATSPALISTYRTEGNVWRVPPSDILQAKVLANLLKADFPDAGRTTIDVVFETTDYGTGLGNELADNLIAMGFPGTRHPFKRGDGNDQTTVVNLLSNETPKATVLIAFPPDIRDVVTKAKAFPVLLRANGHRWYLADAAKDPALLVSEDGGASATLSELDQAFGTAPAQGAGGAFIAFRDAFRTRYGIDPNSFSYTSHSYDAMWLVMLSTAWAQSTGTIAGPQLGQGMGRLSASGASLPVRADKWTEASNILLQGLSINIEGASGPLDFDLDAGVPSSPYEIWQVSDGGIRVLRLANP